MAMLLNLVFINLVIASCSNGAYLVAEPIEPPPSRHKPTPPDNTKLICVKKANEVALKVRWSDERKEFIQPIVRKNITECIVNQNIQLNDKVHCSLGKTQSEIFIPLEVSNDRDVRNVYLHRDGKTTTNFFRASLLHPLYEFCDATVVQPKQPRDIYDEDSYEDNEISNVKDKRNKISNDLVKSNRRQLESKKSLLRKTKDGLTEGEMFLAWLKEGGNTEENGGNMKMNWAEENDVKAKSPINEAEEYQSPDNF